MTMNEDLKQKIDACRPNHDDLTEPEMAPLAEAIARDPHVAEVYQRSRQWDTQLATTMSDVAIPVGLADRLCEALKAAESQDESSVSEEVNQQETLSAQADPSVPSGVSDSSRQAKSSRMGRRTWLVATAATVLISGTLGLWFLKPQTIEPLTVEQLREFAPAWRTELAKRDAGDWNVNLEEVLNSHPISTNIDGEVIPVVTFCKLEPKAFGHPIAYNLTPSNSMEEGRVFLVVIPISEEALASEEAANRDGTSFEDEKLFPGVKFSPPNSPSTSFNQGASVAVWRSDTMLYVLIIENECIPYKQLIIRPTTKLI